MDETRKNLPSIPPNYVTLLQLEQRRLERKAREEEEEERKLEDRRLGHEQEEQKRKKEEKRKPRESTRKVETKCGSSDLQYRKKSWKFQEKNTLKKEEISSEMKNQGTAAAVVFEEQLPDQEQKVEMTNKKRHKKGKNKKKPKSNTDETREKDDVEKISPEGRKEENSSGQGAMDPPENGRILGQMVPVERSVEVAEKIASLTIDDGGRRASKHRNKLTSTNRLKYKSFKSEHRNRTDRRDATLVWVRKDEIPDSSAGSANRRLRE